MNVWDLVKMFLPSWTVREFTADTRKMATIKRIKVFIVSWTKQNGKKKILSGARVKTGYNYMYDGLTWSGKLPVTKMKCTQSDPAALFFKTLRACKNYIGVLSV